MANRWKCIKQQMGFIYVIQNPLSKSLNISATKKLHRPISCLIFAQNNDNLVLFTMFD